jgi:hypothetical protein
MSVGIIGVLLTRDMGALFTRRASTITIAEISEVYPTLQYKILVGIAVPDGSSC